MLSRALSRASYANVTSTIAIFLALGGGAVIAKQSLLNGKRIKPGTIPANRIQKHSLTSIQIKLSKLGSVPLATRATHASTANHASNADHATSANTPGGLGPSAFVRSDRIIEGTPVTSADEGARILFDPASGADVRHSTVGVIQITNTNATDSLEVNGVSSRGSDIAPQTKDIGPGDNASFFEQAFETYYLDVMVLRIPASGGASGTVALHLTCGENPGGDVQIDCIGVR